MKTESFGRNKRPQVPPNFVADKGRNSKVPMNIGLGLDGTSPSPSSNDPMRVARQAIRSQVTAREYIERQLVHAQSAIEELRTKLRHVHHEREVAVSTAQSAIAARETAERSARAAESALISERGNRARIEGMLRDAETTIRDLREKLATANQTMQVERAAERLNRQSADDEVNVASEVMVPTVRDDGLPVVERPVGTSRKIALAQPAPTMISPVDEPLAIVSPTVGAVAPASRRPVGRPRKMVVVEPISKVKFRTKEAKQQQTLGNRGADIQEPVQWWVEGWKNK
jgi:hypothetical protein